MNPFSRISPLPPFAVPLTDHPGNRRHSPLPFPTDPQPVEWEPEEGSIYRDLHGRYILVLTADIDKLLVEFTDGTTRIIDIFEWRDLQPIAVADEEFYPKVGSPRKWDLL
ncbi:hypothetical protein [Endothiovibrio diazotrophicus]